MHYTGPLHKMHVTTDTHHNAQYYLEFAGQQLALHECLGQQITLQSRQQITCIACGKETKKSFAQGYCYPCFSSLAECDTCIMQPETCHYAQGTCRQPLWGDAHCYQTHMVYLANTGALKVGISRQLQHVSSRWIDQGASQAIVLCRVANRKVSGLIESAAKSFMADKTNWRTMLKGQVTTLDMQAEKDKAWQALLPTIEQIRAEQGLLAVQAVDLPAIAITYPVRQYPDKVSSLSLDKTPVITGQLLGIKGQYLLLDDNRVINLRKHAGYHVELTVE